MDDIIQCEKIVDFALLTNRKHGYDDCTYRIDEKKFRYAVEIIKYWIDWFPLTFFGCSVVPDGTTGIVRIRTNILAVENIIDFQNVFLKIDEMKIIPVEEHFIVEATINNMFSLCDDEEFD